MGQADTIGIHYRGEQRPDRGTWKVCNNLLKGLDELKLPYRVNPPQGECLYNGILQGYGWAWDKKMAELNILWGPNITVFPREAPWCFGKISRHVVPCKWVEQCYKTDKNMLADLHIWPVGVDTESYYPIKKKKTKDCLIYYKTATRQRTENDITIAINELNARKQTYSIIRYGSYTDAEFREACLTHRWMLVLAGTESQFIALLEAYSMGIPAYILDMNVFKYGGVEYTDAEYTTAPYTDERCGIVGKTYERIDEFLSCLGKYRPRDYVESELTLAKCAKLYYNIITYA